MKKMLIVIMTLVTLQVTAQEKKKEMRMEAQKERRQMMKDLTPEEMATLQTKKMTLHLDLTEAQQQKIKALNLEEAKLRKAKIEERTEMRKNSESNPFTKEDKLKMMNEQLDRQIERKQKMKSILNADQYEKWEASQGNMAERRQGQKKMMKHKMNKEKNKQ